MKLSLVPKAWARTVPFLLAGSQMMLHCNICSIYFGCCVSDYFFAIRIHIHANTPYIIATIMSLLTH